MITEQDSAQVAVQPEVTSRSTAPTHHEGWHSPAQILSWLPKTATPWQQDSAIRANYKFVEKDWLHMHNPMRTPTTKADPKFSGNLANPFSNSFTYTYTTFLSSFIYIRYSIFCINKRSFSCFKIF